MSWFIAKRVAQAKDYQVKREARNIMSAYTGRHAYSMEELAKVLSDKGTLKKVTENLDFLATCLGQLKTHDKIRALSLFVEIAKLVSGTKMAVTVNELKDMPNEQLEVEVNRLRDAVLKVQQPN